MGTILNIAMAQTDIMSFATEQVDSLFGSMGLSEHQREQLITETCEKYTTSNVVIVPSTSIEDNNEQDVYEIYLGKVDHIVDIINKCGGSTDRDNLAYNKDFLVKNYQKIVEMDDVDTILIDWYIEEAKYALVSQDFPTSSVKLASRTTYNRSSAVDYVNKYYSSYNSVYPDWSNQGGDCANFISQCAGIE